MSKHISVRDDVYEELEKRRLGNEKPSDTLARLFGMKTTYVAMSELPVGGHIDVSAGGYNHTKAVKFMVTVQDRVFDQRILDNGIVRITRLK